MVVTSQLAAMTDLEEVRKFMETVLAERGFSLVVSGWNHPIANVWSVRVGISECPQLVANGKGISQTAALVSAMGEMLERLSCNYFFNGLYLSASACDEEFVYNPHEKWFPFEDGAWPSGLLDEAMLAHYNLSHHMTPEELVDNGSGNRKRGLCALPFTRQRQQQRVWIPVNIISNLYVGNGMAVGNDRDAARVQALSEIFERHIKTTIITDGISLPPVPKPVLARYPHILEMKSELESKGWIVEVKDASLNGRFPLINVNLLHPVTGGCFSCFGAHPRFQTALERAFTEQLQGRTLESLNNLPEPTFDLNRVAEQANLDAHFSRFTGCVSWDLFSEKHDYHFVDWDIPGSSTLQFEHLCDLIHRVDMDIYIADYDFMGVPACRIIVPGMSEVHPVSRLMQRNDNRGYVLRPALLSLPDLSASERRELLDQLEDLELSPGSLMAGVIGVLADTDSSWDQLSYAELRLLINLSLGEREQLEDDLKVILSLPLPTSRIRRYRCLNILWQLDRDLHRSLESYRGILIRVFGQALVDQCIAMLEGQAEFPGFFTAGSHLEGFERHQQVLQLRSKVQKAKERFCKPLTALPANDA
ncbi:YcaO-like family protein [Pokkaliibacter sp. CJK22405]|uniref:YcaO-like family protein n=1 Tax=Pokkaliibacter sp. CJK22405 TaxID=3384615 RepID=UPI003984D846